jgi:hypothetical protein
VELEGGALSLLKFTAEEIVGVAESFKKGGEKRCEDAGIAKEQFVKLLPVHEVKAGRFEGAGGSGAGFVIKQGHFAKDISRKKMTEGGIALAVDVNGDFDTAF